MSNRVVHFEIPAKNPTKIMDFYSKIFGWQFEKWDGPMDYWMIITGKGKSGINGGLMKRQMEEQPVVDIINVKDIDATLKKIKSRKGNVFMPKMAVVGVGWLAYFRDPEQKNIFGVMQEDKKAK